MSSPQPTATLAALAATPDVSIPRAASVPAVGTPTREHITRVLDWARLSGLAQDSTVTITSSRFRGDGIPYTAPAMLPLPELARPADADAGLLAWELTVTEPGRDPVQMLLMLGGRLVRLGSKAEQEQRRLTALEASKAEQRRLREEAGHGLLDAVERATRQRILAEETWLRAIRAAVAAETRVAAIAEKAKISTQRVYQIRDDKR